MESAQRIRTDADPDGSRLRCAGTFDIRHGPSRLARLVARALRLPDEGSDLPTTLRIVPIPDGRARWRRQFGASTLTTTQRMLDNGLMSEQFQCLELRFRVDRTPASVHHVQMNAACRLGALRIPLPRWVAPQVAGSETATSAPNRIRVQVAVRMPLIGDLIAYDGIVDMLEPWP
jgi:hypothetical protein